MKNALSKLKMPPKKAMPQESDAELEMELKDFGAEESPKEDSLEDMPEMDLGKPEQKMESNPLLAKLDDEELMAEVLKRGLLDGSKKKPEEDMEMEG